jgi:L-asparagine transporter-like permease
MEPTPPNEKKPFSWPLALNLGLLMLAAFLTEADPGGLAVVVLALAVINGIAAVIMRIFGKMNYVLAFVLSMLLILLIGLGICALLLSNMGGMH